MKLPKYGKTCVVLEGILCYKFVTIWLAVDIPQILLRIVVQEGKRNRLTYKLSIFSVVRSLKIRPMEVLILIHIKTTLTNYITYYIRIL